MTSHGTDSSSPESLGVCEKLLTAIKASPAFRHNRDPAHRDRDNDGKSSNPADSGSAHMNKVVEIESRVDRNPEIGIDRDHHDHDHGRDPLNRTFSEFISRAGTKIRTVPEANHDQKKSDGDDGHLGMSLKKRSSFRDHCMDYINGAMAKISHRDR